MVVNDDDMCALTHRPHATTRVIAETYPLLCRAPLRKYYATRLMVRLSSTSRRFWCCLGDG
jgi:hypothetical protein